VIVLKVLYLYFVELKIASYPIQVVSGAPGSGNDWLLWLGSIFSMLGFGIKGEVVAWSIAHLALTFRFRQHVMLP